MTYPGAEHTRFSHSLGVFNFAQQILAVLQRRYANDRRVAKLLKDNARVVKAAALLHDIGHGPFSHLIERAFPALADHERKTITLIQESGSIPLRLQTCSIPPEAVAKIIQKTSEHRFLIDIVSSQLDADRMDYILRDAMNTGVAYGAFDAEWVLNSLCLGGEPNADASGPRNWRLCLEEKRGLFSAEQLVMARMPGVFRCTIIASRAGGEYLLCVLRLAANLARDGQLPAGAHASSSDSCGRKDRSLATIGSGSTKAPGIRAACLGRIERNELRSCPSCENEPRLSPARKDL